MKETVILLTVATKWEEAPLARKLGRTAIILKTGVGGRNASRALAALEDPQRFSHVLSTGFAGALQPGMRSGDVVLDPRGLELETVEAARETAAARGLKIHFGKIVHSDSVVASPEAKAELGRRLRACAVDMETEAVRRWAEARGIPSPAVRVVIDEVGDRLPEAMPADETFGALACYAAGHLANLPMLVSLGLKQRRAGVALASFLQGFLERL